MSNPIVFVSVHRVVEGGLGAVRELFREGVPALEADKPHTVFFHAYVDEVASEVAIVHVFLDEHGMDLHMEGAADRAAAARQFLEPRRFEIYGEPSPTTLEMMKQAASAGGADLVLRPAPLGGFSRLGPD